MLCYRFIVTDSDGLWGEVRVYATSLEKATKECKLFLAEEFYPKGLLNAEYTLDEVEGGTTIK